MSIKANELRIGNWVYGEIRPNEPMQITDIATTICKVGEYLTGYESVQPIPLTESILDKAGFIFEGQTWTSKDLDLVAPKTFKGDRCILAPNPKYAVEVKYLHQLQNLIFALTGKELDINL